MHSNPELILTVWLELYVRTQMSESVGPDIKWQLPTTSVSFPVNDRDSRIYFMWEGPVHQARTGLTNGAMGGIWDCWLMSLNNFKFHNVLVSLLRECEGIVYIIELIRVLISIEEAFERKKLKYVELVAEAKQRCWQAHTRPVEIGVRSFVAKSTTTLSLSTFSGKAMHSLSLWHQALCNSPLQLLIRRCVLGSDVSQVPQYLGAVDGQAGQQDELLPGGAEQAGIVLDGELAEERKLFDPCDLSEQQLVGQTAQQGKQLHLGHPIPGGIVKGEIMLVYSDFWCIGYVICQF